MATYNGGCPTNLAASQCAQFYGDGADVATTKSNVFVSNFYMENVYFCTGPSCASNPNCVLLSGSQYECYADETGFEYWLLGSPAAQPTMIDLTNMIPGYTVFETGYFDVDSTGNLWTYAYAGESTYPYTSGTGIVEITNPTTSPAATVAIPFGSMPGQYYWGMSYVSNHGAVLNVTDPYAASTGQYTIGPSGVRLFNTLGPNGCEPLSAASARATRISCKPTSATPTNSTSSRSAPTRARRLRMPVCTTRKALPMRSRTSKA